jgi:hypothetical protein
VWGGVDDGGKAGYGGESVSELPRLLQQNREALRALEDTALADVAQTLVRVCETQMRLLKDLEAMQREEWMTPEQAKKVIHQEGKSWERVAPHLPRRYLSERVILYPRSLLDAALYAADSPENSVVSRSDEKSAESYSRQGRPKAGSGGLRSLEKALKKGS